MKLEEPERGICERLSRPARGAWIEISGPRLVAEECAVAPRKGRVD